MWRYAGVHDVARLSILSAIGCGLTLTFNQFANLGLFRGVLILIALIGAYVLINGVLICAYSTHDDTQLADTAIVLGAGTFNGEVSPVYQERLNHAVWLYQEGYVDTIIPTGGTGDGSNQSDASAAKDYLMEKGIPETAILGMYKAILPSVDSIFKSLLIFNLPFTFAKGVLVSIICFLVYKSNTYICLIHSLFAT